MIRGQKNEGYIGVTSGDPEDRFKRHGNSKQTVGQKIREYGLTSKDMRILEEGLSGAEARKLEHELRPKPGLGWNTRPGGGGISDDRVYPIVA